MRPIVGISHASIGAVGRRSEGVDGQRRSRVRGFGGHDQRGRPSTDVVTHAQVRDAGADAGRREVSRVASAMTHPTLTAQRRCSGASWRGPNAIRANLALEPRARRGEGIGRDLLIDMHRLCMLPQIVESGESPGAVTLERALAGMFSGPRGEHDGSRSRMSQRMIHT